MTKTAQLSIARGLAEALPRRSGVTVNSVLPGPTRTELLEGLFGGSDEAIEAAAEGFLKSARPSSLNMRLATVEEVANMVCYVASPASSATNGACLRCDGGIVQAVGH
jgi:NAD(P)-dependent dehydrogenase (short-subunit alcohol dehydrogenase family)